MLGSAGLDSESPPVTLVLQHDTKLQCPEQDIEMGSNAEPGGLCLLTRIWDVNEA